jgi:hypothetical protein
LIYSQILSSTGLDRLYLVSYLWYSPIGMATVVVVGLAVSLFTGTLQTLA